MIWKPFAAIALYLALLCLTLWLGSLRLAWYWLVLYLIVLGVGYILAAAVDIGRRNPG